MYLHITFRNVSLTNLTYYLRESQREPFDVVNVLYLYNYVTGNYDNSSNDDIFLSLHIIMTENISLH